MRSTTLTTLIKKEKNNTITTSEQCSLNKFMKRQFELNEFNTHQDEIHADFVAPVGDDIHTAKLNSAVAP